jgi:hypothetical protein
MSKSCNNGTCGNSLVKGPEPVAKRRLPLADGTGKDGFDARFVRKSKLKLNCKVVFLRLSSFHHWEQ